MLDVRKLALLREVSLYSGVTGAARALGVSTSSVSQQISRLEHETGVLLLEKSGRGVRLTQEAERLVTHTERVLATLEEAESELERSRGGLSGVVRLVTFHAFALRVLPRAIAHLERIAPGLSLEFVQLDPEDAMQELGARRADIVVVDEYPGLPLPPSQGLVKSELGRDVIDLYVPSSHLQSISNPAERAPALAKLPWVMEPRISDSYRWTRNVCRSLGFEPRVAFESPNLDIHCMLVMEGLAAAFLPRSLASSLDAHGNRVPGLTDDLHRTVSVLTRRGTERSSSILACKGAIEAAYLELAETGTAPAPAG